MPFQSKSSRSPQAKRKQPKNPQVTLPQGHPAICADCNAPTTVPFRPVQDRSVYCSNCLYLRRRGMATALRRRMRLPQRTDARHGKARLIAAAPASLPRIPFSLGWA